MNEKRKVLIVIGVLVVIIAFIAFLMIQASIQRQKIVNAFNDTFNSNTEELVYLGRPGCSACITFSPTFEKVIADYKLSYLDINTDEITEAQLHSIVDQLELDWDDFGTPTIAVVKEGKVVKSNIGVISEESLITFLKESNVISE